MLCAQQTSFHYKIINQNPLNERQRRGNEIHCSVSDVRVTFYDQLHDTPRDRFADSINVSIAIERVNKKI